MPSGGSRSQKAASSESEGEESSRISTHDEGSDTNYDDDDGYDYDSGGSSSSGGSETECPTCEKERRKESKASKRPLEKVDEVKGVDPGDLAPGTFLEDYMNEGQPQQAPASATGASQQQQQQQPTANKKAKASSDEDSVSAIVKLAVQQYQQQQLQQQQQQQQQQQLQQQQQQQPAEKKTKKPAASRLPAVGHKESGAFALAPAVFAPPAKTAREQKQQQRVLARRLGNLGKQLQSALSEYQDLSRELNPPGQQ